MAEQRQEIAQHTTHNLVHLKMVDQRVSDLAFHEHVDEICLKLPHGASTGPCHIDQDTPSLIQPQQAQSQVVHWFGQEANCNTCGKTFLVLEQFSHVCKTPADLAGVRIRPISIVARLSFWLKPDKSNVGCSNKSRNYTMNKLCLHVKSRWRFPAKNRYTYHSRRNMYLFNSKRMRVGNHLQN